DYQLHKEVLPSGNINVYHYNDKHQIANITCYNEDCSHKLAEIDFKKEGDKLCVSTSDKQEVIYSLKKAIERSNRGKRTISAIHKPGYAMKRFGDSKKGDTYDKHVRRLERDDGFYIETKYYHTADNKFLQKRVRLQRAPVGPGGKKVITHRYFYHK